MKYLFQLNIIALIALMFISCKDELPIIPGLTKSKFRIVTTPDSAIIKINNQSISGITPLLLDDYEPGFYKLEIKRKYYLDSIFYFTLNRNIELNINIELRENPIYFWDVYNTSNSKTPTDLLTSILIDNQDNIYVGTVGNGALKIVDKQVEIINTSNSGLINNYVNKIVKDKTGAIYFLTDGGFSILKNGIWKSYSRKNSNISEDKIKDATVDNYNNLWLATESGLIKFNGFSFYTYSTSNSGLPSDNITALIAGSGNSIWIGTLDNGIAKYDGSIWKVYNSFRKGLQNDCVNSLSIENDNLLYASLGNSGSGGGYSTIDNNGTILNYNSSNLPVNFGIVYSIKKDKNNNFWIANNHNLAVFKNNKWKTYTSANSLLPSDYAIAVDIDSKGNVWCICRGLLMYKGNTY